MPFPCRVKARFTHTMPRPCHEPAILMLLITKFLELRVVEERRRQLAGRQHSVPTLFACRQPAATLPRTCRERHIRGMAGERQGNGRETAGERNGMCVN